MNIRPLQPPDVPQWRELRVALWPHYPGEQIDRDIADYNIRRRILGVTQMVLVAEGDDGRLCGFIELSLRTFARGCGTSPVGYIEGWYVTENVRRKGVGAALVAAGEQWARQQGCCEMASDCVAGNLVSYTAHMRLGYVPTSRHTTFRKPLGEYRRQDPADWIALVGHELRVELAVELVTDARAGGIDVFLGTTRAETTEDGRELIALDYEAYEQMAIEQMHALAQRCREKWPVTKLVLMHRIGRVPIAEPSVIIAVSTPHRADAFEACRFLIDELKRDVAIWKKEVWADGTESWVHPAERG